MNKAQLALTYPWLNQPVSPERTGQLFEGLANKP
jgi:hypothetical protein